MLKKISINLLPTEFAKAELAKNKFYKLRIVSILAIFILIFLTSTTIALRILQNRNLSQAQFSLQAAEGKVTQHKEAEIALTVLKDRLSNINQIINGTSKQSATFSLINSLVPPSAVIDAINIDHGGNVTLSMSAPDSATIDNFISDLTSPQKNESKISVVNIDSFSRSKEAFYRVSLKITAR